MYIKIEENEISKLNEISKKNNLTIEKIILEIINNRLHSIIELDNGFYYDKNSKRLFNSKNKIIILTNYEELFFDLLIENLNKFVNIEDIFNHVWKKNASIYALRNIVKKIRDKSYYEIIINKKDLGYKVEVVSGE